MACFTIVEFNGDHLSDMVGDINVGHVLRQCISNPFNAKLLLDEANLDKCVRIICQNGNPITTTNATHHLWLNPDVKRKPGYSDEIELSMWQVLGDLETLNMGLSNSQLQAVCSKLRSAAMAMKREKEGK